MKTLMRVVNLAITLIEMVDPNPACVRNKGSDTVTGNMGPAPSRVGTTGQRQEALTILDDLERRRSQAYVGGVLLAVTNLGVGESDRTISWLEQAAEERDSLMTVLNVYFFFDPLRSDPRFQALLRRMNVPQQP